MVVGGGGYEYLFILGEDAPKTIKIERTTTNTKPFFRDLSKPLLLKNEFNTYNIEYVVDNVRRSEDFGDDNHVYLYYDNIEVFCLLLQAEDFSSYLKDDKIIFVFGEEDLNKNYPLNFQGIYNISYDIRPPQPLRVDEIKRLLITWVCFGCSGHTFLREVLDGHKNLLITPEDSLSVHAFMYIYKKYLENKTLKEALQGLCKNNDMVLRWELHILCVCQEDGTPKGKVSPNRFIQCLSGLFPADYTPNMKEWCIALYLAYSMATGRNLNQRIIPYVVMDTHGFDANPRYVMGSFYNLFNSFKYFRGLSVVRRPTISFAAIEDRGINNVNMNFLDNLMNRLLTHFEGDAANVWLCPHYIKEDDPFLPFRMMIRFEDLKLQPRATLEAVCDFLDISWDNILLFATANREEVRRGEYGIKSAATGYDTKPVYNLHERVLNIFDHYRFEALLGDMYSVWGYKPMFYKGDIKYSKQEIFELFRIRFNIEKYHTTEEQIAANDMARKKLYYLVNRLLTRPYDEGPNGEKLVPIPWLKPKEEFIEGELYE